MSAYTMRSFRYAGWLILLAACLLAPAALAAGSSKSQEPSHSTSSPVPTDNAATKPAKPAGARRIVGHLSQIDPSGVGSTGLSTEVKRGCPEALLVAFITGKIDQSSYEIEFTQVVDDVDATGLPSGESHVDMSPPAILKTVRTDFDGTGLAVICARAKTAKKQMRLENGFDADVTVYSEDPRGVPSIGN